MWIAFVFLWTCIDSELRSATRVIAEIVAADSFVELEASVFQILPDGSIVALVEISYDLSRIPIQIRPLFPRSLALSGFGLPFARDCAPKLLGVPLDAQGQPSSSGEREVMMLDLCQGEPRICQVVFANCLKQELAEQVLSTGRLPKWMSRLRVSTEYSLTLATIPNWFISAFFAARLHHLDGVFGSTPSVELHGKWISAAQEVAKTVSADP